MDHLLEDERRERLRAAGKEGNGTTVYEGIVRTVGTLTEWYPHPLPKGGAPGVFFSHLQAADVTRLVARFQIKGEPWGSALRAAPRCYEFDE